MHVRFIVEQKPRLPGYLNSNNNHQSTQQQSDAPDIVGTMPRLYAARLSGVESGAEGPRMKDKGSLRESMDSWAEPPPPTPAAPPPPPRDGDEEFPRVSEAEFSEA